MLHEISKNFALSKENITNMRALIEDTKKLTVNNNNNYNNNNSNSEKIVTTRATTSNITAATPKAKNSKISIENPKINVKIPKLKEPRVVPPAVKIGTEVEKPAANTSFINKTYKMQQQQQQQQQTTISNTTNVNAKGGKAPGNSTSPPTVGVKLRSKQPQQKLQQQQNQKNDKKEIFNNNTTAAATSSLNSTTISIPKASHANTTEEIAGGVQDTIYLCNFRVSVDGEWLCLKELQDIDTNPPTSASEGRVTAGGGGQRPYSHYSQKYKRYSAGDRSSYGGGGGGAFEDNGIFALHNFIAGRRLYDEQGHAFHTNMLTAPHARESGFIGVFGGGASQSSNEWSNLCRSLFMLFTL